jgi:hypothetical protein
MQSDLDYLFTSVACDDVAILVTSPDVRNVLDAHSACRGLTDNRSSDLLEVIEFMKGPNQVDGPEVSKLAAGLVDVFGPQCHGQVVESQTERRQSILIGFDDNLGLQTSSELRCGHARHRFKPGLEPTIGDLPQIVEGTISAQGNAHDGVE